MTKFYENLNLEIIWKLKHTIHLMVPLHFCMKSKVTSLWHRREFIRRTIFSLQTDGRQVGRWYGQDGSNTAPSTSIGRVINISDNTMQLVYTYTLVSGFSSVTCVSPPISRCICTGIITKAYLYRYSRGYTDDNQIKGWCAVISSSCTAMIIYIHFPTSPFARSRLVKISISLLCL